MLSAAYPVFSIANAAHYYEAMLSWQSTLALLALSACIYFLCQAGMARATALSQRQLQDNHAFEEMHDTLIQGVQGLMLSLQATASQLPGEGQGRAQIEGLLDEADKLLGHGGKPCRMSNASPSPAANWSRRWLNWLSALRQAARPHFS